MQQLQTRQGMDPHNCSLQELLAARVLDSAAAPALLINANRENGRLAGRAVQQLRRHGQEHAHEAARQAAAAPHRGPDHRRGSAAARGLRQDPALELRRPRPRVADRPHTHQGHRRGRAERERGHWFTRNTHQSSPPTRTCQPCRGGTGSLQGSRSSRR